MDELPFSSLSNYEWDLLMENEPDWIGSMNFDDIFDIPDFETPIRQLSTLNESTLDKPTLETLMSLTNNENLMNTTNDELEEKKFNIDNLMNTDKLECLSIDELNDTSEIFNDENLYELSCNQISNNHFGNVNENLFRTSIQRNREHDPFLCSESANRLLSTSITDNQTFRCKDYSEKNHFPKDNSFSKKSLRLSLSPANNYLSLVPLKLASNGHLPNELEKPPKSAKSSKLINMPSISVLKSKRQSILELTHSSIGKCKKNFQGPPKALTCIKYLESDGDSPRSESPQSYSGDEQMSFVQDQMDTLQYISNGAAAASRNTSADENQDQRVRRLRFIRKKDNSALTDSDIWRNTLNDHSYTLNDSSLQRLMIDSTSESEEEIDVVSFSKRGAQFKKSQNLVSAVQMDIPERRGRGRPKKRDQANLKRTLEDKTLPSAKRVRNEQEAKRTLHNRMERKRRNNLNLMQEKLKNAIPELATKPKASRASVLTEGQKYIQRIETSHEQLLNENKVNMLKKANLEWKVKHLKKMMYKLEAEAYKMLH